MQFGSIWKPSEAAWPTQVLNCQDEVERVEILAAPLMEALLISRPVPGSLDVPGNLESP